MAEVNQDHEELIKQLRGVRRIVINRAFGGFSLSREGVLLYLELAGIAYTLMDQEDRDTQIRLGSRIMVNGTEFNSRDIKRDDPALVTVVRRLGSKANGEYATLKIVEIPGDVDWFVDEYDGKEWVAERHRTWR
jgi:hypothetical protein